MRGWGPDMGSWGEGEVRVREVEPDARGIRLAVIGAFVGGRHGWPPRCVESGARRGWWCLAPCIAFGPLLGVLLSFEGGVGIGQVVYFVIGRNPCRDSGGLFGGLLCFCLT